jgi:hypothetical protein
MKYQVTLLILSVVFLQACFGQNPELQQGVNNFGEIIQSTEATPLANVNLDIPEGDSLEAKISGTIGEVCQAKGCWMTLSDDSAETSVFIRFKDYGFFVPKNASGKKAVVVGDLFYHTTSVDELRHYAEDKGASEEEIAKITEPQEELRMIARGVIIYNS